MSSLLVTLFDSFLGNTRKQNLTNGQLAYDCPVCSNEKGLPEGDGKGNLEINYEQGIFNCWSCGSRNNMKGRLPYLINRLGNPEILKQYLLVKPESYEIHEKELRLITELPKEFIPFSNDKPSYLKAVGLEYLKSRNIDDKTITKFNMGYSEEGTFKNRIIIPSYDKSDTVNFLSNRAIETKSGYNLAFPKYMNPDADKTNIIFNEKFISWNSTIYLVEGVFDHIITPNSICLLGKILSEYIHYMLYNYAKSDIVICLDADAYNSGLNIYRQLDNGKLKGRVKIIKLNNDLDISKINEIYGKKGLIQILQSSHRLTEKELWKDFIGKNLNY